MEKLKIQMAMGRMYVVCLSVAMHLGCDVNNPDYSPMQDKIVLDFIENASTWQIQAESQQIKELEALDREVA